MKNLFLLALLLFATACDPYGGYEYKLNNKSSHELNVFYSRRDSTFQKTLSPDHQLIIGHHYTINGLSDLGNDFLRFYDSISIQPADQGALTKNIWARANWDYKAERTGRLLFVPYGENRYSLTITDADVVRSK